MLHILSSVSVQRNKERILENYQKQEAEHSAYIVVPEQATMQMDVWILDEMKRESLMDLRVVSFQKLSKEVLESTLQIDHILIISGKLWYFELSLRIFRRNLSYIVLLLRDKDF